MSLNSYLDDIASKLIIKGEEKEAIKNSLDVFKSRMNNYFTYNESVYLRDIRVFGSYERDTNLTQSVDEDTDVDIMLVMTDDGATPQTYLDRVRRAVEAKYSRSEIRQSSPTIVLQMGHMKFEITPAIVINGIYHIKNSSNLWMPTYCYSDLSGLTDANVNNYSKIKPAIRLVKYWNKTKNVRSFSSYQIEQKIVSHYSNCKYQGYDTKAYLLSSLECLRPLVYWQSEDERLEKAISKVSEAIEDEVKYPSLYMDEIKSVIGEL